MSDNGLTAADLVGQYSRHVDEYAAQVAQLATMRAAERERAARLTAAIAEANERLKTATTALKVELSKGPTT